MCKNCGEVQQYRVRLTWHTAPTVSAVFSLILCVALVTICHVLRSSISRAVQDRYLPARTVRNTLFFYLFKSVTTVLRA